MLKTLHTQIQTLHLNVCLCAVTCDATMVDIPAACKVWSPRLCPWKDTWSSNIITLVHSGRHRGNAFHECNFQLKKLTSWIEPFMNVIICSEMLIPSFLSGRWRRRMDGDRIYGKVDSDQSTLNFHSWHFNQWSTLVPVQIKKEYSDVGPLSSQNKEDVKHFSSV